MDQQRNSVLSIRIFGENVGKKAEVFGFFCVKTANGGWRRWCHGSTWKPQGPEAHSCLLHSVVYTVCVLNRPGLLLKPPLLGGLGTCVHARVTAEANAAKLAEARPRTWTGLAAPHTQPSHSCHVTKLGHLVTTWRSSPWRRSISSLCRSRDLRSLTFFPRTSLKEKVLKNMPVQKQPYASQ